MSYGYRQLGSGRTTGQVSSYRSEVNGAATAYTYTYDSNGNITRITDQSGKVTRYTYDKLGQLTREDNPYLNKTYVYTYDNAGNRLSKKKYAYTTGTPGNETATESYNYTGDRLTQVGSVTYAYDAVGNPTTYNGYTLEWNGRKLMEMSMNGGQFLYTFAYNADGIRTVKTNGSTIHHYTLNGSQIVTETWTTKSSSGAETPNHFLVYLYDENGAPVGLQYRSKSDAKNVFYTYYFEKNLQGDIIAIYNAAGKKIGTYTYDAWGNFTFSTASDATTVEKRIVRTYNPFRYRGYYYDTETKLYYLQSRYYNPETGRFLNVDSCLYSHIPGYNLYLYCHNNPVNYYDPKGDDAIALLAGWASSAGGLAAADGPLPIGDIIYGAGCLVLGSVVIIEAITVSDEAAAFPVDNSFPTVDVLPYDTAVIDAAIDAATVSIRIGVTVAKEKYDPDPFARPGQKKQGRERKEKKKGADNWNPNPNKRPKPLPHHTPGRDHQKY